MSNTYYTVSVLPEIDLDSWYVSPIAAEAVAWDCWSEGCTVAIHKHEINGKRHIMALDVQINPDGSWG